MKSKSRDNLHVEKFPISNKESRELRLEALKLAYEVALKTEVLTKRQTPEERYGELISIFELSDVNYNYLLEGKKLES